MAAQCAGVAAAMDLYLVRRPHPPTGVSALSLSAGSAPSVTPTLDSTAILMDVRAGHTIEIAPGTIEALGVMLPEGFKRFVAHVGLVERKKGGTGTESPGNVGGVVCKGGRGVGISNQRGAESTGRPG